MRRRRRRPGPPAAAAAGPPLGEGSLLAVIRENVDGMLVIDRAGTILLANPSAERLLGRPAGERLEGTPFGAPVTLGRATDIDVVAAGAIRTAEMRVVAIDWNGSSAFLASLRDVTDRKHAEAALARVGAQHAAIAQLGKDAVSGLPPEGLMAEAARHIVSVLATDFAAVLEISPEGHGLRLVAAEWAGIADALDATPGGRSQPGYTLGAGRPVVMDDVRGETRFEPWPPGLASAATLLIEEGERHFGVLEAGSRAPRTFAPDETAFLQSIAYLLAAAVARFRAEREVRHQALHDPLTGLANRVLFVDRLTHALARSRRHDTALAMAFADLDGFKQINDSAGHQAGDEVLVEVSRRLTGALRSSDSLARFGGDEFVMLLENVDGTAELTRSVARLQTAVSATPFVVNGLPHQLEVSIGVAWADAAHASPDDLIRDADAAMYHAKHRSGGGQAVFDDGMRQHAAHRVRLERELRMAIDAGQLRLLYQPIVALDTGRVVELEALLRWEHPERGLLEPIDFLDIAIETRLIVAIGKWALPEACRHAAGWRTPEPGSSPPTLNFNMAPSELAQPELRAIIGAAVGQGDLGLDLQLELTEGALIADPTLPATLRDLSDTFGVRTALDDFGTGYSSLAYLARFQVDELKIDRSFIRRLRPGRDEPIVSAIVSMAHALGILVVAEGIETAEQATRARELGCDRGQGFFLGRPLPPQEVPALLAGAAAAGPRA